ncbi:glutaredoxin-C9-like [Malania oleifera]|uniref:glutaredoxin-C9-like n=1 Tax=Malania oleifera TaxID=397392 RepID=UPI0025ADE9BB|nr:glutaredoxin-C9-like [Malania oleifera]
MQQAVPYRAFLRGSGGSGSGGRRPPGDNSAAVNGHGSIGTSVRSMVLENPVIVFGRRGCCMCHVVKLLLLGLGVNPTLYEVDEGDEAAVVGELARIVGAGEGRPQFPAVFVGGKLFGGLERVMATHISGELVPILKDAGALWL